MVYAPNNYSQKPELWDYLVHFMGSVSKPRCVIEDINEILHPFDRKGCKKYSGYMEAFRDCLTCKLFEPAVCGKTFTLTILKNYINPIV
jgi:hypothetical protein